MKINNLFTNFISKVNLLEKKNVEAQDMPAPSPQLKDVSVSYTLKDVRTKAKEPNGKQAILDEMRFILDEVSKDLDSIDINKLSKSFLTVHNMDYKMKYMMQYFASKGIKPGSVLYKHLSSFFYTAEGRQLFDGILAIVESKDQKNGQNIENNLIDYRQYCIDRLQVIDNFFNTVTQNSGFTPEQLIAIYSLPSYRGGTAVGNSELMFAVTGAQCKFSGSGDIAIGNDIKLELKAPKGTSASSCGKFTGGVLRDGAEVINFVSKAVARFITDSVRQFDLNRSSEEVKQLLDLRKETFALNPNYNGNYNSLYDLILNLWSLVKARHIESQTYPNVVANFTNKVARFLERLFANAWTREPNKAISNIFNRYFVTDFINTGEFFKDSNGFIAECGMSFLIIYANGIKGNNNSFTHIGVFNGKLDNSARLVIIPVKHNFDYNEIIQTVRFICPDTTGNAGRRANWGIMS